MQGTYQAGVRHIEDGRTVRGTGKWVLWSEPMPWADVCNWLLAMTEDGLHEGVAGGIRRALDPDLAAAHDAPVVSNSGTPFGPCAEDGCPHIGYYGAALGFRCYEHNRAYVGKA